MEEENKQENMAAPEPTSAPPAPTEQKQPEAAAPAEPAKEAPAEKKGGEEKNTGMAIVAYILFFIPLLTDAKKDPFVKFHVRQGVVIFGMSVILWAIRMILPWYWLWKMYWLFNLIGLGILILAIIGIVNAANGKKEKLPLVGDFGDKVKI